MACTIEPPVQAALIGVAGVFLTAMVTLFTNSSKLRQDRDLALRKDVYLELLDAIAEAGVMITALLEEETDVADVQRAMKQLGGAVAKMQIVAPAEAESAAFELQLALNKAFVSAMLHRQKLAICWARSRGWQTELEEAIAEARAIARSALTGTEKDEAEQRIDSRARGIHVQADLAAKDQRSVYHAGKRLLADRVKEVIATSPRLTALMRKNLGLEMALDRYEKRSAMIAAQIEDAVRRNFSSEGVDSNVREDA